MVDELRARREDPIERVDVQRTEQRRDGSEPAHQRIRQPDAHQEHQGEMKEERTIGCLHRAGWTFGIAEHDVVQAQQQRPERDQDAEHQQHGKHRHASESRGE
jgi:hypothetical protein